MQIGDGLPGELLETSDGHRVFRFDDVDEVMGHRRLFFSARFRGADIHTAVHLVGVRVHDLGPLPRLGQPLGNGDAKPGLA